MQLGMATTPPVLRALGLHLPAPGRLRHPWSLVQKSPAKAGENGTHRDTSRVAAQWEQTTWTLYRLSFNARLKIPNMLPVLVSYFFRDVRYREEEDRSKLRAFLGEVQ